VGQTECITEQQVMGLETIHLHNFLIAYPELPQGDLGKQRQHHRRCWGRCRAFVPWDLLIMGTQVEANLPLNDTIDQ
jgi:hypothetical protein